MSENKGDKVGIKHPLLVYRFIAGRYRPVGVLLFVVGLLAQLGRFIPQLQSGKAFLGPEQLAQLGVACLIAGAGIWILTIFMGKQAYVQCQKDYLMIHLMFSHVAVAYQRINEVKTAKVSGVFDLQKIKGRERNYIKPLIGESALAVEVKDWPIPEKKLRSMLSQFLFDTREQGFIFIVPAPSKLSIELNTFTQHSHDRQDDDSQRYLDPIERLRLQKR